MQFDAIPQMADSLELLLGRAPDHPMNFIGLFQQELSQIAAILTSDSSD